MKTILTLFLCLMFSSVATAQSSYSSKGVRVYDGDRKLSRGSTESLFYGSPVYDDYMTGMRYNRIGNSLLWPGVAIYSFGGWYMIFSAIFYGFSEDNNDHSKSDYWRSGGSVGIGLMVGGVAMIAAGATFKIKARRKVAGATRMYKDFLLPAENRYAPELSFGSTSGGIGLAYKF